MRKLWKFILRFGKLETVNTRLLNKISETVNRILFKIILLPHERNMSTETALLQINDAHRANRPVEKM